jgi:hypothetical protein
MEAFKAALIRLGRILIAQVITFVLTLLTPLTAPWAVLLGALINSVAKFLRDQFGWDWLPI